ncbi:hypothetical protein SAMN04488010_1001 [Maribacter stanieri]|uniref:Virus attachment protein p12 family protein n=1 Tax=Maribacter stanieri TaxID=440514 RepID=A0A1I6I1S1_9FLAO|nr:hypothetical protein SAMN04488010_1001 [Maribacter stanieri]
MDILQHILVYITLAISVGYIATKFFIPKSLWSSKKSSSKACGQNDCGCH